MEKFDSKRFYPQTPTEMMLINHIHQLEKKLYYFRTLPEWRDIQDQNSFDLVEPILPTKITLYPSTRLLANIDEQGRLVIRVDAYYDEDDKKFGTQNMTDVPLRNKYEAADMAMAMYKDQLHNIAGWLETGDVI